MNWEAIGAIGEMVSAIGVIGTLIYLAIQIRGSTLESRLVANTDVARDYNKTLQHISSDEDLSRIWITALENFESLSKEDRARAIMVVGNIMRILENAYLQFTSGRMQKESWESYEMVLKMGVGGSFFTHYWELRKDTHSRNFGILIERLKKSPNNRKFF